MTANLTPEALDALARDIASAKERLAAGFIDSVSMTVETADSLIEAARELAELKGALEFLHNNGGIICRAVPVGQDPWPETYGIDPVGAARRMGWKPPRSNDG